MVHIVWSISSKITANIKARIFFLHRVPSGYFFKIDKGGQTLPISAHEMAPMRAFFDFTKMAKMTPLPSN